jgi:LDH2 family malate/lactate/ureidoglycolate dehydrogenase
VSEARDLSRAALKGIGYDDAEAGIITDHVIDAALCGYEYSGLPKILSIPEHPRFHRPRRPLSIIHETPVSCLYDGGNNVGMIAVYRAAKAAIQKAAGFGIAAVAVTNSWYSGRSAYFVEMIARSDLVAIHVAGSFPFVAPLGGKTAVLGTNPIAFGLPGEEGPISFDMGTSAFMGTDLLLHQRLGRPLPEGVAIDADGNATRDPTAALGGALLTFGGHKGYGLSFMVQALALLGGAGLTPAQEDGYVFLVMRPDLLVPMADYKRELAALIRRIKNTPRQPGVDEILIPSERSARARKRNLQEGLTIDREVYEALQQLC